jgi:hypothetical protein
MALLIVVVDTEITAEDRMATIGQAFSGKARRKLGLFVSNTPPRSPIDKMNHFVDT